MRIPVTLFFGVFVVMALSNAIVPVLPVFADASSLQGAIYSAYFLGALVSTLPGGILSDRFGRITVMKLGLVVTVATGLLLSFTLAPVPVLVIRLAEGIGAGFFVAAAMSYVNSRADHENMSGYFMALLNAGLVLGLVCSGWLSVFFHYPGSGVLAFTLLAALPLAVSLTLREPESDPDQAPFDPGLLRSLVRNFRWMWLSSVILVGITGIVISLYPKFSGLPADTVGVWIAGMSVATIVSVLLASRFTLSPVETIRWSAVLMAVGALLSFYSPLGLVLLGAVAGIVMIAQMSYLAGIKGHQGTVMGLFSTTSYLGMAILPVLAGFIADTGGFFAAFLASAAFAVIVVVTIGRCSSCTE